MDHHNTKTQLCYPSQETLAEALNCSDRTVRSSLNALSKTYHIRIKEGQGPNGSNLYILNIPRGKKAYLDAAVKLQLLRKELSAKPLKKPKKKPSGFRPLAKLQRNEPDSTLECSEKRAKLEHALISRLGGGEAAWAKIQNLEESMISDVLKLLESGQIDAKEGAERIVLKCLWGEQYR